MRVKLCFKASSPQASPSPTGLACGSLLMALALPASAHQKQDQVPCSASALLTLKADVYNKGPLCARHSSEHVTCINSFDLCNKPMHITVIIPDFTDEEIQAWRLNSLPRASGLGGALTGTQAVRPLGSYHCVFPALLRQHLGILFTCFFFFFLLKIQSGPRHCWCIGAAR